MSQEIYKMPLSKAMRIFTKKELIEIFGESNPAFLRALLKSL